MPVRIIGIARFIILVICSGLHDFFGNYFFYLIKLWKGYKYAYLPKSTDLEQYFKYLSDYQEESKPPASLFIREDTYLYTNRKENDF